MTKRASENAAAAPPGADREWTEAFGLVGERIGMPRTTSRILGWLLICEPPCPTSTEIAGALGLSRASVSIGTRLLMASGLVRRVPVPASRVHAFEIDPGFFAGAAVAANPFGTLRRVLAEGVTVAGGEDDPRTARLREARDFYAFVEQAIPEAIERFRVERQQREEASRR